MLKIVQGNIDEVKEEMLRTSRQLQERIKHIKKKHREKVAKEKLKEKELPPELQKEIDRIEELKKYFRPSRIIPVRVKDLVINYKAYEKYMKKIKSTKIGLTFAKSFILTTDTGHVEFYDLSTYYKEFEHIPVAEWMEEE